tara:strand:- start:731 stop:910 length:180 start_codon:yes stop_codon:yes gene_type:complete
MTPKQHAEILLRPRDIRNPDYGKARKNQERIIWIDMLISKDMLMGHSKAFWIETKKYLK